MYFCLFLSMTPGNSHWSKLLMIPLYFYLGNVFIFHKIQIHLLLEMIVNELQMSIEYLELGSN